MFDAANPAVSLPWRSARWAKALSRERLVGVARERWAIAGVLALAALLYVYRLDQNGYANTYYSGAVKSMSQSWKAFFFGSIDTGNFITVDKPPAALWFQALSVRAFGFSSWSLLLPEAIAGVFSVGVLYAVVRRPFGELAAVIAAFALATTPITAATVRENLPDSVLVLVLLLSAWSGMRAVETGRLRWAIAAGALVGFAFNVKMLQAFIVLPTLAFVFLVAAPITLRRRLAYLGAATAALVVIGGSWMTIVDALPEDAKPYIGGSSDGTVRDLVLGYNGLGRITGDENRGGGPGGSTPAHGGTPGQGAAAPTGAAPGQDGFVPPQGRANSDDGANRPATADDGANGQFPGGALPGGNPVDGERPGGNAGGGPGFGGDPGWLRMFNAEVGTQIGWLIPLALGGAAIAFLVRGRSGRADLRRASVIFWFGWTATHIVVFSKAQGIFHPYYTSALAPGVAALVGIGVVTFIESARRVRWSVVAVAPVLAATVAVELALLDRASGWHPWLAPVMVVGIIASFAAFVACTCAPVGRVAAATLDRMRSVSMVGAAAFLLLTPALMAFTVLDAAGSGNNPGVSAGSAVGQFWGPGGAIGRAPGGGGPGGEALSSNLVSYLEQNRGDARWMVAVQGAQNASAIIIQTGQPVMGMGGFSGSDPAPTLDELKSMIAHGEVRFFLSGGMGAGPGGGSSSAMTYVTSTCKAVDAATYGGTQGSASTIGRDGRPDGGLVSRGQQLYDCAGAVTK